MKFFIPFVGFTEKIVQMNLVQGFFEVFRDTRDTHRVLIVIPLTLFISHSLYLQGQTYVSVIFYKIHRAELIWLILGAFIMLFVASWAVFSSSFNPALYIRQIIFVIWTGLLHRLSYGLESLGTTYFTIVSFIALTSFLPFAITGLKVEQLFRKLKEDYESGKKSEPAVISVPAQDSRGKVA